MTSLLFKKHERISLKAHPEFDERWLQSRIAEDTSILGLGDLILVQRERAQERAGRLDLLLTNSEEDRRYEVELMLGATDKSHIIRCIEYWDIERRRYPAYDHCSVLVAEDITSQFLNVIALLAGTIPLVAIQLNALKVDDFLILDFVRVLDQRHMRRDDVAEASIQSVDRSYWVQKSTAAVIAMADEMLTIINEKSDIKWQLNFTKYHIGLTDGKRSRNFIYFRPRKKFLRVVIPDGWNEIREFNFDEAGLETEHKDDKFVFNLSSGDLSKHRDLLTTNIQEIVG